MLHEDAQKDYESSLEWYQPADSEGNRAEL